MRAPDMERQLETLKIEVDADGIGTITFDDASRPMNVVSSRLIDELCDAIESVASNPGILGVVLTSAKPTFMAGADLKHILGLAGGVITLQEAFEFSRRPSMAMHRRLETCGKPFVAAINGLALGGGYELCLACHYRVIVDDPEAIVGLPEVTVGLLPASGGTQRLPRMIGMAASLPILLEGRTVSPAEALRLGMVDAVVPAAELIRTAREWLLSRPSARRPWDEVGFVPSRGLLDPAVASTMTTQVAVIAARTQHNYPAPIAILETVFQGMMLPFDVALTVESKQFARLLCGPVSRNLIRTNFVNKLRAGKRLRTAEKRGVPGIKRVGVLGAGMMGSGIAFVCAASDLDVVLVDTRPELVDKGKAYANKLLGKDVEKGRRSPQAAQAVLDRIQTTTEYASLQDCDLVIEAVFEDIATKAEVTRATDRVTGGEVIFASNTSTLPISDLARASKQPANFIGLHFFSPVERMPLVEVIVGRLTSGTTVARALEFVRGLRMTPIVVRDSRGFYTSRVFQTYIHEAMALLEEGVSPPLIENAARLAGFPTGPLALLDEVTLELPFKITQQAEVALGERYVKPCGYGVMHRMLSELDRPGKRYGKGFYEYSESAGKHLWPGLANAFARSSHQPPVEEVRKRLLYIQSMEAARCLEEEVISGAADADLGSVLGWGFPAWTGGTLSLIDTVGVRQFVLECDSLAAHCGARFVPSDWLRERAQRSCTFHPGGAGD